MMYVLFLFSNDRAVRIPLPIYIRSDAGLVSLIYNKEWPGSALCSAHHYLCRAAHAHHVGALRQVAQ